MLYKQVFSHVKRYVLRNSGDLQSAEDIFHDSVLRLIVKVRDNQFNPDIDLFAYLYTSCKNAWLTKAKRDQKVRYHDYIKEDANVDTDEHIVFSNERKNIMNELLESLGETCRDLLKLTFYLDYSLKEASEKLGISNADVAKTYQYRCKKKLTEKIKNNKAFMAILRP